MAGRKRELGAGAANAGGVELAVGSVSNNDFLADVIRTAEVDAGEANVEKRTKYIKEQLDRMSEEQLTRFEFFVRSHLSRSRVKDILVQSLGQSQLVTGEKLTL
jgi:hypothetical protein